MNDADREELGAQIADIGCIPETALDDSDIAVPTQSRRFSGSSAS
jgi:hypothetical protein